MQILNKNNKFHQNITTTPNTTKLIFKLAGKYDKFFKTKHTISKFVEI